jgi:trehalose synthase
MEVSIEPRALWQFEPLVSPEAFHRARDLAELSSERLKGRVVWNVNSTAAGGGVAEMLRPLLSYARGIGVDARWLVIRGNQPFFRVTKRLHHALHGSLGDGSKLDDDARRVYEETSRDNLEEMRTMVRPRDIVILHDPQTAGLAPTLMSDGAEVIWRCHVGHDTANVEVERGWGFLYPYLKEIPTFIFSRQAYVPDYLDHDRTTVITPSVDAFSPKNQELNEVTVRAILNRAGLIDGPDGNGPTEFVRADGTPGRVERQARVVRSGEPPRWETPLVVQVSRWDPLKDPVGVLRGFARFAGESNHNGEHLLLIGPDTEAVTDDPEGAAVFEESTSAWRQLPDHVRQRIHLVSLPMNDVDENAAMVNAVQRRATIVVQKSLQEGFGLTVTEAMWKARPIVASAVGAIRDQVTDGVHGLLLQDPTAADDFAEALRKLLTDPALAAHLGRNARERVGNEFLGLHHLIKYAELFETVDQAYEQRRAKGG